MLNSAHAPRHARPGHLGFTYQRGKCVPIPSALLPQGRP
jgi:hypothetical protein